MSSARISSHPPFRNNKVVDSNDSGQRDTTLYISMYNKYVYTSYFTRVVHEINK